MSGFLDNTQINYVFQKEGREGSARGGKNLRSIFIIIFFSFPFPPSQSEVGHSGQQFLGYEHTGPRASRAVSWVTSSLHARHGFMQPGCLLHCIPSHERYVPKDGGTWPPGTCWHRALLHAMGMLDFPHCRAATWCVVVPNGLQPACCAWRCFSFWISSHPPALLPGLLPVSSLHLLVVLCVLGSALRCCCVVQLWVQPHSAGASSSFSHSALRMLSPSCLVP